MILVTGSAGKTGRAVLEALLARGEPARALVRRPEQIVEMKSLGVQEVFCLDLQNPADMQSACAGASQVYHICPNLHPGELHIGRIVIEAARQEGIEHFVFHSVLLPQVQAMPHHWQKLLVEEQLIASGLSYTILQPAVYMQNILASRHSIFADGTYPIPYLAETRLSYVDLEDVAQAAAIVLTEPGHEYATYPLAGTSGILQTEIAEVLSQVSNRRVVVEVLPLEEWEVRARARGLGGYQVETLVKMFRYYAEHGLPGNPQVLHWLLGHPPTTLATFLEGTFCQALMAD